MRTAAGIEIVPGESRRSLSRAGADFAPPGSWVVYQKKKRTKDSEGSLLQVGQVLECDNPELCVLPRECRREAREADSNPSAPAHASSLRIRLYSKPEELPFALPNTEVDELVQRQSATIKCARGPITSIRVAGC